MLPLPPLAWERWVIALRVFALPARRPSPPEKLSACSSLVASLGQGVNGRSFTDTWGKGEWRRSLYFISHESRIEREQRQKSLSFYGKIVCIRETARF